MAGKEYFFGAAELHIVVFHFVDIVFGNTLIAMRRCRLRFYLPRKQFVYGDSKQGCDCPKVLDVRCAALGLPLGNSLSRNMQLLCQLFLGHARGLPKDFDCFCDCHVLTSCVLMASV